MAPVRQSFSRVALSSVSQAGVALALLVASARAASVDAPAAPEPGLVRVVVTAQQPDPLMPWQNAAPFERHGYGVLIEKDRLVTVESLVRNSRLVELLRPRSGEKIDAAVVRDDSQMDFALLNVSRPFAAGEMQPIPPVETLAGDARMEVLQLDETGELQRIPVTLLHRSMDDLSDAPFRCLMFTMQADTEVNGQGAPVVSDGRLVGLVIDYDRGARTASVLPYPDLNRFLADTASPHYRGPASAGFFRSPLIDPAKRAYLNVTREGQGVLVTHCIPGTPIAETLRANDVILEWDGHGIDNLGFYTDADFGRLDFAYLIKGRHWPGDKVPVTIVRDRREMKIEATLCSRTDEQAWIPEDFQRSRRDYVVEGGLVLRELTGSYLKAFGPDWMRNVDSRLVHMYLAEQFAPPAPGDRIVILAGVLADPINVGYERLQNQIVTAVNGKPVRNMQDVQRIARTDGHLFRFTLKSSGVDVVLDPDQLDAANRRLSRAYGIGRLRYEAGAPPADGKPGAE